MAEPQEPISEDFFNLPLELQEEIMRQVRLRQLPGISRASRELYQTAYQPYLERLCAEPLRQAEINRYVRTLPLILGNHFCINEIDTMVTCDTEVYIRLPTNNYKTIRIQSDVNLNLNTIILQSSDRSMTGDNFITEMNQASMSDFDLLSEYRIRASRLGCVRRQPNYARDFVIHKLDTIYRAPINSLDDEIWVFLYLWMNSYSFNIYPSPSQNLFFPPKSTSELLEIINHEVVRLFIAIRKKLEKLDE